MMKQVLCGKKGIVWANVNLKGEARCTGCGAVGHGSPEMARFEFSSPTRTKKKGFKKGKKQKKKGGKEK